MFFSANIDDIKYFFQNGIDFYHYINKSEFPNLSEDLVNTILNEAGKFATNVIAPVNSVGDKNWPTLNNNGEVTTSPEWKQVYNQWVNGGWGTIPCAEQFGGQNLPITLSLAIQELWNSASSAYGIGTLLTQGAVETIAEFASDKIKLLYLPKMVTGEWTGTMNLTEPHAGSDLSKLKTKAIKDKDGWYLLEGTKSFITYGEHDLTENIIHLVLARLPDAPKGTKGISLFLVPKFLVNNDGSIGKRNDVKAIGLEHKLGIHASPTCTMSFGENNKCKALLVGEENQGLMQMFKMMNNARLHVGIQGVAVAELACQQAVYYAKERKQGGRNKDKENVAIVNHPDVKRMLLTMQSLTNAARIICYKTAWAVDCMKLTTNAKERNYNNNIRQLLTPIAKAFATDIGVEVTSLNIQVHGGAGYIEETGAAQHFRDSRITPIYEGTNGIQAIDLVMRKLTIDNGSFIQEYISELDSIIENLLASKDDTFSLLGYKLKENLYIFKITTNWLQQAIIDTTDKALAAATNYLEEFALVVAGIYMVESAYKASVSKNVGNGIINRHLYLSKYFVSNHLVKIKFIDEAIRNGTDEILKATFY